MAGVNLLHYIDPFTLSSVSFDGKSFEDSTGKHSHVGSRISYNDIIHHSFKVSEDISEEELRSSVEIRMYEEAGLDIQKSYKISYVKKELDFDEMILVEAFAVEVANVKSYLAPIAKKNKHIDFIAVPFLAFSTLYKRKIIATKNDVFIYLGEEEAFVSLYKDGKYLSTKSIANINNLQTSLEDAGIKMSADEIFEHLLQKGLDATSYERTEVSLFNEIEAFFSRIFTKINDVIVYNRSIFGFENAERILLSTQLGRVKGLRAFIENFGILDVEVQDFNLFKEKTTENYFERIVTAYIFDKLEEDDFAHSINLFEKEPPFYMKESGRLILVASLVLLASFTYLGALWYENKQLAEEKKLLSTQYDAMKKNASKFKQQVNEVKKSLSELEKDKKSQEERYEKIEKTISLLEGVRAQDDSFGSFILSVHELLKRFDLSVIELKVESANLLHVKIVAPARQRENITQFMKALVQKGFVGITTEEISSDDKVYMSNVVVQR